MKDKTKISVDDLIGLMCDVFKLDKDTLLNTDNKSLYVVKARNFAIYVCSKLTTESNVLIGRKFRMNTSSAWKKIKRGEILCRDNQKYKALYQKMIDAGFVVYDSSMAESMDFEIEKLKMERTSG